MFSDQVRSSTASSVTAVAKCLASIGLTPNMLTLIGASMMMSTGIMVAKGYLITAAFCTIIFSCFDALDGSLARYTNNVTKFGGFLDSVTDRYAEFALFLGVLHYLIRQGFDVMLTIYVVFLALAGSFFVPYCRSRAEAANIDCKGGIFSRFERLVVIVLTFLLAGLFNDQLLLWGMGVIAVFANITSIQRILHVYHEDNKAAATIVKK